MITEHTESACTCGRAPMPDTLLRLRNETRDLHTDLEQEELFLRLREDGVSLLDYGNTLAALYLAYSELEPELEQGLRIWLKGYHYTPRLPLLADDLKVLSVPVPERVMYFPLSCPDRWQTLGSLYVVEGSMLGGQVILRHIRDCLCEVEAQAFFSIGETSAALQWSEIRQQLQQAVENEEDFASVVAGARRAFTLFLRCAKSHRNLSK